MPVLVLNDFDRLTIELMNDYQRQLSLPVGGVPRREKLWASYWTKRILDAKWWL